MLLTRVACLNAADVIICTIFYVDTKIGLVFEVGRSIGLGWIACQEKVAIVCFCITRPKRAIVIILTIGILVATADRRMRVRGVYADAAVAGVTRTDVIIDTRSGAIG